MNRDQRINRARRLTRLARARHLSRQWRDRHWLQTMQYRQNTRLLFNWFYNEYILVRNRYAFDRSLQRPHIPGHKAAEHANKRINFIKRKYGIPPFNRVPLPQPLQDMLNNTHPNADIRLQWNRYIRMRGHFVDPNEENRRNNRFWS